MFFHLSRLDNGESFEFSPMIPKSALVSKEGNIPRVCVCPTVFHCLRAITGNKTLYSNDVFAELYKDKKGNLHPFAIYKTNEEPFLPPKTSDFRHNKEHWFINSIRMERIGYLDLLSLMNLKVRISNNLKVVNENFIQNIKDEKWIYRNEVYIVNSTSNRANLFID